MLKQKNNITLILVGILVSVLIIEILFNLFITRTNNISLFSHLSTHEQALQRTRHERHHYLGYIPKKNFSQNNNKHNSLGYRGEREIIIPKPDNIFRIVALGASTTYTSGVEDDSKSYPYLLEQYLHNNGYPHVEVVNAGVSGYTTWESLINLEFRILDLEPDLILVYHSINDIDARIVDPMSYQGDNSGSLSFYENPDKSVIDTLALTRLFRYAFLQSNNHGGVWTLRHLSDSSYLPEFRSQFYNNSYPDGLFSTTPLETILARNKPIYFKRNLINMIAIAKANDVNISLATFAWSKEANTFTSLPEYQDALNDHNQIISELCDDYNIKCFDFNKHMSQSMNYFTDGHHVNEDGSELKSQLFGRFLITCSLLNKSHDIKSMPDCEKLVTHTEKL